MKEQNHDVFVGSARGIMNTEIIALWIKVLSQPNESANCLKLVLLWVLRSLNEMSVNQLPRASPALPHA